MVNVGLFWVNGRYKMPSINLHILTKKVFFFNKPKKNIVDVTFVIIASLNELVCSKNHNEYIYSIVKQEIS